MKHFEFRKRTRELADAARLVAIHNQKEKTHADEDDQVRPEDRQGPREGEHRPEGQGEGSAAEEGSAGEVGDAVEMKFGAYGMLLSAPLSPAEWEEAQRMLALGDQRGDK